MAAEVVAGRLVVGIHLSPGSLRLGSGLSVSAMWMTAAARDFRFASYLVRATQRFVGHLLQIPVVSRCPVVTSPRQSSASG